MTRDVLLAAYAQILPRMAIFFAGAILARFLDLTVFASFSLILLTATTASGLSLFGTGILLSRYIARDQSSVHICSSDAAGAARVATIGATLAAALILLLPAEVWGGEGEDQMPAGFLTLAAGVHGIASAIVAGKRIYGWAAIASSVQAVIIVVGALASIYNGSGQVAIVFVACAAMAYCAIIFMHSGARLWLRAATKSRGISIVAALRGGAPIIASVGAYSITVLAIGRYLKVDQGPEAFAIYALALQVFGVVLFFPNVIMRVLVPRLIQNGSEMQKLNGRADRSVWAVVALGIVAIPFVPWLLSFYGIASEEARSAIVLVLLAAMLASPSNIRSASLLATGLQSKWLILNIIWASVAVGCCILLAKIGGAGPSAAVGSLALAYGIREMIFRRGRAFR